MSPAWARMVVSTSERWCRWGEKLVGLGLGDHGGAKGALAMDRGGTMARRRGRHSASKSGRHSLGGPGGAG